MKSLFTISAVAVLFVVAPSSCFALSWHAHVTRQRAKELGMEVRIERGGLNDVRVELEFRTEGELKRFAEDASGIYSRIELRVGGEDQPSRTARLHEDRSKPGRIVVDFTADQAQLDKLTLLVYVPADLGRTIYDIRVKDFVELKKDP